MPHLCDLSSRLADALRLDQLRDVHLAAAPDAQAAADRTTPRPLPLTKQQSSWWQVGWLLPV
jgi:hypothetical protein